jgi:methylglyoxal/glyoxal reductase
MKHLQDCVTLHNGVQMPWVGLGVYKVKNGEEVINAVRTALEIGYRHIDTAAYYENEEGVGKAIRESGIPREEIFITTKVWNSDQGYETTLKAFETSLQKLIGVSNFQIHHLEDLMADCEIKPMVNQVEYHPRLTQKELHAFCKQHGIQLEAWSPLMRGEILQEPTLVEIGEKYGKTPAQVVLRWDLQNEVVTIPKSVTPQRIKENSDIFDFELTAEEIAKIDALNLNKRIGPDPDNFDF